MFDEARDTSSVGWPIVFTLGFGFFFFLLTSGDIPNGLLARVLWRTFPLSQFLYIGPLAMSAKKNGERRAFQGWLIGAALAALLYLPCWGEAWSLHS